MQEEQPIRRRKRGVRASRQKLEKALHNAGFKTQVSLAEYIAELESLDAAPKDMVNKVFREVPVSLHTIERIAQALKVEAFSLYLTREEIQSEHEQWLNQASNIEPTTVLNREHDIELKQIPDVVEQIFSLKKLLLILCLLLIAFIAFVFSGIKY